MSTDLPIKDVLSELRDALSVDGAAVLVAPPGAGKTTVVAPALLGEEWCTGQIILTSPRRVAARAAAERMAELLGEKPGETIGYQTRLDSKASDKTRVLIVTEAIFVNRIVDDPELLGVSAVLFDEAHERHLDGDLGLALALESRSVLREDLRVLVMSATIDGARFADLLGDNSKVIESEGRAFPLAIKWVGARPEARIEDAVTDAVMLAWRAETGDLLAFLPGVGEIERARDRLAEKLPNTPIFALHGQVHPEDQRLAIRRDKEGRRRVVLATAIAETSLTLDGVSVVVDSGLARYAQYDKASGTTRLVTRRASQAAAAQRAGRAARQGPGVAYRLWEEGGHAGRPEFAPPEIATTDLAPMVLKLAKWGTQDCASFAWLDAPTEAAISTARNVLQGMGALDDSGRITPWGQQIASLPIDPVGAAAVLFGAELSQAEDAAKLVLLLQERGLGGQGEDLLHRLDRWNDDKSARARASRKLAHRWARAAEKLISGAEASAVNPALFLAFARPDFIAKRRDKSGENWISAGGRGYQLDPASPLARAEWIVIGDARGVAKGARITAAAELSQREIDEYFNKLIEKCSVIHWNNIEKRIEAKLEKRLGAIALTSVPDPSPDASLVVDKLVEKALEALGQILPDDLIARARFAQIDAFDDEQLRANSDVWLRPLLEGRRDFKVPQHKLADSLFATLEWGARQQLESLAPREFISPADTRHKIDYASDDAPAAEVRVQALFGLDRHPMVGSTPLLIKLTSPAGRPIQSTRDLPGFWRGSWVDVRKEMKGRYPKHRWPEQPWVEKPSLKTKNAFNRDEK